MDKKQTYTVTIYSDGSSLGNPGPGGTGYVSVWQTSAGVAVRTLSGGAPNTYTTNNRMEISALVEGFRVVKREIDAGYKVATVNACLDSEYTLKGITIWIHNWIKRNWKTADKTPVSNKELWLDLCETETALKDAGVEICYTKVLAHSGVKHNEAADTIARSCAVKQEAYEEDVYL